jgi:hypothetical protein
VGWRGFKGRRRRCGAARRVQRGCGGSLRFGQPSAPRVAGGKSAQGGHVRLERRPLRACAPCLRCRACISGGAAADVGEEGSTYLGTVWQWRRGLAVVFPTSWAHPPPPWVDRGRAGVVSPGREGAWGGGWFFSQPPGLNPPPPDLNADAPCLKSRAGKRR